MATKKVLIINGHPDKESFNFALSEAYKKGAEESGAEIQVINIRELNFNPNLQFGYRKRTELEPDLLTAQDKIMGRPFSVDLPCVVGLRTSNYERFFRQGFTSRICFSKKRKLTVVG